MIPCNDESQCSGMLNKAYCPASTPDATFTNSPREWHAFEISLEKTQVLNGYFQKSSILHFSLVYFCTMLT